MAHREFMDSSGRSWQVWSVSPERAERRQAQLPPPVPAERRQRDEFRVPLGQRWARGWLCFETKGEKRRLAPYPSDWAGRTDAELEAMCAEAIRAGRATRRLIE